jgi:hypothetical protein
MKAILNIEQGMSNAKGKAVSNPSKFAIPCSVFNIVWLLRVSLGGGQNQGESIPPIKETLQGHGPDTAVGVIGVDDPGFLFGKVNQGNNMTAGSRM